jgi:kumamolisin
MSARKVFHNSVITLPEQPGIAAGGLIVHAKTADFPDETLGLHFALSTAADIKSELEAKVAAGEVASPEEIAKLYTAVPADTGALVS